MQEGCATLLALNKWDLAPLTEDDLTTSAPRSRASCACAQGDDDQRAGRPQRHAGARRGDHARRRRRERIPTPGLNRFLAEAIDARQPPAKQGHRLKLLYMAQIETRRRASRCRSTPNRVTRDYMYYLENRMRARFGLDGVPVIIDVRERKDRHSEK